MKGEGNQQDYGMRIYDPRIGKFLSVDPITAQYPELTPYQFASNRPIDGIDQDGLEKYDFRGAKANKLSYSNGNWYQDRFSVFGSNSIRSAWNQSVDAAELDANFLSDPQGTISSIKKSMVSAVFKGVHWLSETSDAEKVDFAKKELTDVSNYESIAGNIILARAAGVALKAGPKKLSLDIEAGGSRDLNPLRGNMNCAACAEAGDATLKGYPATALNNLPNGIPVGDFFKKMGGLNGLTAHTSTKTVINAMEKMGDGATGVIYGMRNGGKSIGHYFNVVNKGGAVQFIDFQNPVGSRVLNPSTLMKSYKFEQLIFKSTTSQ